MFWGKISVCFCLTSTGRTKSFRNANTGLKVTVGKEYWKESGIQVRLQKKIQHKLRGGKGKLGKKLRKRHLEVVSGTQSDAKVLKRT